MVQGVHDPGGCAWFWGVGACAWSRRGVHGPRGCPHFYRGGCAWSWGGGVPGGVCMVLWGAWSRGLETPLTATAAGGTHPTGVRSCFNKTSTLAIAKGTL